MNEIEVYRVLYGELVECVPHYNIRLAVNKYLKEKK